MAQSKWHKRLNIPSICYFAMVQKVPQPIYIFQFSIELPRIPMQKSVPFLGKHNLLEIQKSQGKITCDKTELKNICLFEGTESSACNSYNVKEPEISSNLTPCLTGKRSRYRTLRACPNPRGWIFFKGQGYSLVLLTSSPILLLLYQNVSFLAIQFHQCTKEIEILLYFRTCISFLLLLSQNV